MLFYKAGVKLTDSKWYNTGILLTDMNQNWISLTLNLQTFIKQFYRWNVKMGVMPIYEYFYKCTWNIRHMCLQMRCKTCLFRQAACWCDKCSIASYGRYMSGTVFLTFWWWIFFLQILAHPVFKMWVIQKPNKVALWNKQHFEEKKMEIIQHV